MLTSFLSFWEDQGQWFIKKKKTTLRLQLHTFTLLSLFNTFFPPNVKTKNYLPFKYFLLLTATLWGMWAGFY